MEKPKIKVRLIPVYDDELFNKAVEVLFKAFEEAEALRDEAV